MNDMKREQLRGGEFPVSAEMLENPTYRHRYYDDEGKLLAAEEIQQNEQFWRSLTPPILQINKN
jgi:hypothetical protein